MMKRSRKIQVRTINVKSRISWDYNLKFVGSPKVHIENHGPWTFQCSICKKWYVFQTNLKAHLLRVHQGLKRFHCDFCARSFFAKEEIREHIQSSHLKYNLKFNCTFAGCTKFFKTKKQLYQHTSYVHSKTEHWNICNLIKLFLFSEIEEATCKICGKVFMNKVKLSDHKRSIHHKKWAK